MSAFAPLLAFAVTYVLIAGMLRSGIARLAMDAPNARSLHSVPVPRTGGIALVAGVLAGGVLLMASWLWYLLALGAILAALSFADDLFNLSAAWRFLGHLAVAVGLAIVSGLAAHHALGLVALLVLATAWMVNLYNFMDGSDGLAGGMALFGFGSYALAAWLGGNVELALAAWVVAAAAAAFLVFNFHPARIFMGDAGSVPLGFFAAAFGLVGWQRALWPIWFPALVFSPFVMDASVTLLKRMMRREKIWQAHREHYYQRLVRMGLGHRRTALLEYAVMAAAGVSGVWACGRGNGAAMILLAGWGVFYFAVMRGIDIKWAMFTQSGCGNSEG